MPGTRSSIFDGLTGVRVPSALRKKVLWAVCTSCLTPGRPSIALDPRVRPSYCWGAGLGRPEDANDASVQF